VCPRFVVIVHVQKEQLTQVPLAKDDDMVKAFPLWRANQPFRMSVLPWRVAQLARHKCPWHEAAG